MATGNPHLLVSIAAGDSPLNFMRFVPGQAVSPITVGFDGYWRIGAPGVARVHVSLLFDGQQLFVATAGPDLQAYINGSPIDGRWWTVQAPAELRFGQACLRVAFETPSARPIAQGAGAAQQPVAPAARTALDGAGQWAAQNRPEPQPGGGKTQLYDPSAGRGVAQRGPAVREAPSPVISPSPVVVPAAVHQPPPAAHQPPPAAHQPQPAKVPPTPQIAVPPVVAQVPVILSSPADDQAMASTMRRPFGVGANVGGAQANAPRINMPPIVGPPANAPHPSAPPANAYPAAPPANAYPAAPPANAYPSAPPANAYPGAAPVNPYQGAPPANPYPGAPPNPGYATAPSAVALDQRGPSGSASAPPRTSSVSDYETNLAKPAGPIATAWRSASLVKKITAFLLPLAIVAVLWPEPEPAPRPAASARALPSAAGSTGPASSSIPAAVAKAASSAPSSIASAKASASPLPSASSQAMASAEVASPPQPAPEAKPAAEVKPAPPANVPSSDAAAPRASDWNERAAIDAAFSGRWQEAATLYDRLGAARPDEPAFREAARIIRETKLRQR